MRLSRLTTIEQVSFKQRNVRSTKLPSLSYGQCGLTTGRSLQFEYAYFFLIRRFLKNLYKYKYASSQHFKIWVFLKANFPISKKSKNSRMGKGKGAFNRWLIKLPQGHTMVEFTNVNPLQVSKLRRYWEKVLNFRINLIVKQ